MIIDFKDHGMGDKGSASFSAPARLEGGTLAVRERLGPEVDPELVALVVRAQAGELDAQAELVRRYRVRLSGFVRPMVRLHSDVEDLVQIIWLKMIRRIPGLREPARFETWLFTLARNTVLDYLRRSRCRPVAVADESVLHDQPDPTWRQHCQELMEAVDLVLRDCGARERRVLQQLLQGASYRSIAVREGVSLNALKVRVHRLRLFLRVRVREVSGELALGEAAAARR